MKENITLFFPFDWRRLLFNKKYAWLFCNKILFNELNRIHHRQIIINGLPAFTTVLRKEQVAGGSSESECIPRDG